MIIEMNWTGIGNVTCSMVIENIDAAILAEVAWDLNYHLKAVKEKLEKASQSLKNHPPHQPQHLTIPPFPNGMGNSGPVGTPEPPPAN